MFEQVLTFNSENAKKQRAQNKDEDFTTRFERSIILPKGKNFKIALLKLQASYSWHNIETQRNNTQIHYSNDGGISDTCEQADKIQIRAGTISNVLT